MPAPAEGLYPKNVSEGTIMVARPRMAGVVLQEASDLQVGAPAADGSTTSDRGRGAVSSESSIVVLPARYVLLPLANVLTGYSIKAMERKIERGDWQEGRLWKRAPDGHILIDMVGYQKWVESR